MKYLDKTFSVPIDAGDNYEIIFGHSGPLKPESNPIRVVDAKGNDLILSSPQKNSLYKQAKDLKAKITDGLCTPTECDIPTDHSVRKMLHSEFALKPEIDKYKKIMKAIGASPKEYDIERLRRRK